MEVGRKENENNEKKKGKGKGGSGEEMRKETKEQGGGEGEGLVQRETISLRLNRRPENQIMFRHCTG